MTASAPTLDVVAIGNAIVDVLARSDDAFLAQHALTKGGMQLIDAAMAESLYADMPQAKEISGGSAANTLAGLAALGKKCGFIGQVNDDQLGEVFAHDVHALGIRFDTPAMKGDVPTARCLILVTPDAQRTMNTFLGASQFLPEAALDLDMAEKGHDHVGAEILDLEIGRSTLQPIGCEPDQQDEAVGIGLHRMRAYGAFPRQMFAQEGCEMGSKRRHAASPRYRSSLAAAMSRSSTGVASRYQ